MRKKADKKDDPKPKYKQGDVVRLNHVHDDVVSVFQGQIGLITEVIITTGVRYMIMVCGIPNKSFLFYQEEISGKVENESKE